VLLSISQTTHSKTLFHLCTKKIFNLLKALLNISKTTNTQHTPARARARAHTHTHMCSPHTYTHKTCSTIHKISCLNFANVPMIWGLCGIDLTSRLRCVWLGIRGKVISFLNPKLLEFGDTRNGSLTIERGGILG